MNARKTIALTKWTFVSKVMSLLFNILSVCHSFSSKEQVSLYFVAAVTIHSDLEPKEIKFVTVSTFSPSLCHKVMGPDTMILVF